MSGDEASCRSAHILARMVVGLLIDFEKRQIRPIIVDKTIGKVWVLIFSCIV